MMKLQGQKLCSRKPSAECGGLKFGRTIDTESEVLLIVLGTWPKGLRDYINWLEQGVLGFRRDLLIFSKIRTQSLKIPLLCKDQALPPSQFFWKRFSSNVSYIVFVSS